MADQRGRWALIDELFHDALARPASTRQSYVRERAGGDDALADEVVALLAADARGHALLDAPAPGGLEAGMRLGPYAVERLLGAGGMSTVYLARRADRQFEKHVAVKLVNQGLAAALHGGRFDTERHVLARLEHPHIARLIDAGLNEFGQPYLVMEFVDGVTLDQWLRDVHPSLQRCLELWLELADAVSYAHRNLVVHRDIKPSNVLVDGEGHAKLVDFGIAKLLEQGVVEQTRTQRFTPRYASPEQLSGEAATTATDVFGLGLLLAEMVGGVHPFERAGGTVQDCTAAILSEQPIIPPRVPADLAAIARMALRKDPLRRYASVAALSDDVQRFRRALPVLAQPESPWYRLRKFAVRHRAGVAAGVLAAVSIAAAGVAFVQQARITAAERDRANVEARKAQQVNLFLRGMLRAADPAHDGRDVRVADILDRSATRLAVELKDQPEIQAELHGTLASTYQGLGLLDRAVAHARSAVELREAVSGPAGVDTAASRVTLGDALFARGDYREAEPTLRQALDTLNRAGQGESATAADGWRYLGEVLNELGQYDEAERGYRRALAIYRAVLQTDDERVAGVLNDLGVLLGNRQDFRQAEPLHRESLAIMRRVHGNEHVEVAQSLHNLAGVLDYQGRFGEAEALYREALAIELKLLGEQHARIVLTRTSLADLFWRQKRLADAESFARLALASASGALPDAHPLLAYAHVELGQILADAGRPSDGEPHLRAALRMREQALPPGHWLVANTRSVLGGCVAAQRRFEEAERLLLPAYDVLRADRGDTNEKTADARRRLRELYAAWGRPNRAARFADAAVPPS